MPLYEFHCVHCQKTVELMLSLSSANPDLCPNCHQTGSMEKLISRVNFKMIGSGGYKADFKKKTFQSPLNDVPSIEDAERALKKDI